MENVKNYYVNLFLDSPMYSSGELELKLDSLGDDEFLVNIFNYIELTEEKTGQSKREILDEVLKGLGDDILDQKLYDINRVKEDGDKPFTLREQLEGIFEITYE